MELSKANIGSKHVGFERWAFRRPRSGEQRLMLITPGFCYRFGITSENPELLTVTCQRFTFELLITGIKYSSMVYPVR